MKDLIDSLQLVIDLAEQGVLDDSIVANDIHLQIEKERQERAISIVTKHLQSLEKNNA